MQPHHRRPPELRIFCIDHPRTVQKTRPTDFNIQALNSKIHYRCRYVEVCKCVTKIMFQHVCFNNPCTKHAKKQQNEQLFGGVLRKWHPWFFCSPIMAMAKMAPPPTGGPYWPWPWCEKKKIKGAYPAKQLMSDFASGRTTTTTTNFCTLAPLQWKMAEVVDFRIKRLYVDFLWSKLNL